MNISVKLSEQAKKDHFVKTGNLAPDFVTLNVELPEDLREPLFPKIKNGEIKADAFTSPKLEQSNHFGKEFDPKKPLSLGFPTVAQIDAYPENSEDIISFIRQNLAEKAAKHATVEQHNQNAAKLWLEEINAAFELSPEELRETYKRQYRNNAYDWSIDIHGDLFALSSELKESYNKLKAKFDAEADRIIAERKAAEVERERQADALKAKAEAERQSWIDTHGSDYLKAAIGEGYNCQRRYVKERAEHEYPGFTVDFDDKLGWKDRSCPSEKRLNQAIEINDAAKNKPDWAEVVWVTDDPAWYDAEGYQTDAIEPYEAIVIHSFLGKYQLYK